MILVAFYFLLYYILLKTSSWKKPMYSKHWIYYIIPIR